MKFSKLHFGLDLFDLKGSKVQGQTFFTEFGRRLALFLIITIWIVELLGNKNILVDGLRKWLEICWTWTWKTLVDLHTLPFVDNGQTGGRRHNKAQLDEIWCQWGPDGSIGQEIRTKYLAAMDYFLWIHVWDGVHIHNDNKARRRCRTWRTNLHLSIEEHTHTHEEVKTPPMIINGPSLRWLWYMSSEKLPMSNEDNLSGKTQKVFVITGVHIWHMIQEGILNEM